MLPLAGYAERLSARPKARRFASTLRMPPASRCRRSVVRVRLRRPQPGRSAACVTEPVAAGRVTTLAEPGPQPVPAGSYGVLGIRRGLLQGVGDCTLSLRLHPTLKLCRGARSLLSWPRRCAATASHWNSPRRSRCAPPSAPRLGRPRWRPPHHWSRCMPGARGDAGGGLAAQRTAHCRSPPTPLATPAARPHRAHRARPLPRHWPPGLAA
jgi:hypothetical protein